MLDWNILTFVFLSSDALTLARQRSWNEFVIQMKSHAFMMKKITIWWALHLYRLEISSLNIWHSRWIQLKKWLSQFDSDWSNISFWDWSSQRGIHDINRSFSSKSNPQFIFHDSPGFEAGSKAQIEQIKAFIAKRAKSTEVHDQLHAIWPVCCLRVVFRPQCLRVMCHCRYCFEPNKARLLLDSDKRFFEEGVAGNGFQLFLISLTVVH